MLTFVIVGAGPTGVEYAGALSELVQVLGDKGYEHRYAERSAGHNWTNWKGGFRGGVDVCAERRITLWTKLR